MSRYLAKPPRWSQTIKPRIALVFVALNVIATVLGPIPVAAASASDVSALIDLINAERADAGLTELAVQTDLVGAAEAQAAVIAAAGELSHTSDLGSITTGWVKMGENVGLAGSVETVHQAFMDSEGHRANILDAGYTHLGVGVVEDGASLWVAEVFMQSSPAVAPSTWNGTFNDDDSSIFEGSIEALVSAEITSGCDEAKFCPDTAVTRGQMAAFLARALNLKPVTGDPFTDDDGSMFEAAIESLAASEITSGCGGTKYCPNQTVSRGQMAAFLVRALGLKAVTGDVFTDDNSSVFESDIEALAAAGITSGCGGTNFCPNQSVTRGQMAAFLVRALGL